MTLDFNLAVYGFVNVTLDEITAINNSSSNKATRKHRKNIVYLMQSIQLIHFMLHISRHIYNCKYWIYVNISAGTYRARCLRLRFSAEPIASAVLSSVHVRLRFFTRNRYARVPNAIRDDCSTPEERLCCA